MKRIPKKVIVFVLLAVLLILISLLIWGNKASAPSFSISDSKTEITKAEPNKKIEIKPTIKPAEFNKQKYSLTDPTSIWVVANKRNPLNPLGYAPNDLIAVGGGQYLRSAAGKQLSVMFNDALRAGLTLRPLSGYRSYQTQVQVYGAEVKNNGQAVADTQSARPGYSEHQTGLSIDIGGGGCGIEDCFGNTKESKWVAANAYKYGFIIRYTNGKQAITGYRAEPWHIRYVGIDLATEMRKQGISTLEEFFGLPAAPSY